MFWNYTFIETLKDLIFGARGFIVGALYFFLIQVRKVIIGKRDRVNI